VAANRLQKWCLLKGYPVANDKGTIIQTILEREYNSTEENDVDIESMSDIELQDSNDCPDSEES
jgi:hypothetical protein